MRTAIRAIGCLCPADHGEDCRLTESQCRGRRQQLQNYLTTVPWHCAACGAFNETPLGLFRWLKRALTCPRCGRMADYERELAHHDPERLDA